MPGIQHYTFAEKTIPEVSISELQKPWYVPETPLPGAHFSGRPALTDTAWSCSRHLE